MNLPNNPSDDFKVRNPHLYPAGGLPSSPKLESDPFDESPREDERKSYYQGCCSISITRFCRRLLDSDNAFPKHFVDALIEAGILASDDQEHAQVQVTQVKVSWYFQERTEIEITPIETKL